MLVPQSMFSCCVLDGDPALSGLMSVIVAGGFTTSRRSISIRRKLHLYIDMAITNMQLSGLKTRCCKETVVTRLLRLWAARTVKKGGGAYGCGLGDAKRLIARRFIDTSVQSDMKLWPFKILPAPADKPMIVVNYRGE
ncbi:hypothetical protein IGI04_026802 [Brassica rapa subsp. trilocularis]|uniref:Uncharacterized protein n=1 Tax=Brassica rapa subsp. trilocularis TaxID=1813537 RepID=A0ABQ7KX34_BRACM|nr:hypothetical protein IGI04_026802 [Brassica rapa subsp. trilocularis]